MRSRLLDTGILTTEAGLIVRNDDLGVRIDHTTVEGMDTGVLVLADGARIGCNASTPPCDVADRNVFAGNGTGLSIRGADAAGIYGNRFGVLRNGTVAGNGRGIAIAGLVAGGDASAGSVIGEASAATRRPGGCCSGPCNLIAGSSDEIGGGNGAGIDLSGERARRDALRRHDDRRQLDRRRRPSARPRATTSASRSAPRASRRA